MEFSRNIDIIIFTVTLSTVFSYVNCKHCSYAYESGYVMHFFCGAYEYCCGPECCRNHAINFYQIWYFWLMIILMLLLCSGGGWWYRFRYRDRFQNQETNVSFPATATPTSPGVNIYGAKPYEGPFATLGPPPPYPSQGPVIHPSQMPTYLTSASAQTTQQQQQQPTPTSNSMPPPPPPPPYVGPPPSYDEVAGRNTSSTTGPPNN